jgi:hypothetical protein
MNNRPVCGRSSETLFILQMIYEFGESWWNDIYRGKLKDLEKKPSHFHFVHYKFHMDYPSANPGL